jgi:RHS repeat-associated protein
LAGQYFDGESSLHYNWHRTYSSAIGRYQTTDPIGLSGGINLYVYAFNHPSRYTDPEGKNALIGAVVATAFAAAVIGPPLYAHWNSEKAKRYNEAQERLYQNMFSDEDIKSETVLEYMDSKKDLIDNAGMIAEGIGDVGSLSLPNSARTFGMPASVVQFATQQVFESHCEDSSEKTEIWNIDP